jgi:8-oxo-dGTP pyrophosphatase MutT (NUDIX family)
MGHIHEEFGQVDHTASAFIVRTDFEEPKIMLHTHKKLNAYLQFGGHVELEENPWQAIAHEMMEESGYDLNDVKILQPKGRIMRLSGAVLHPQPVCTFTHEFFPNEPGRHRHSDITWAFVADGPPLHQIGEGESQRITLYSRQELDRIPDNEIFENVREIARYVLDVCYPQWEQVLTGDFTL